MALKTNQIIIGLIVVAAALMFFSVDDKKTSPAGAVVERSLQSSASPGEQVSITVTITGVSEDFFVVLRENIPSGWIYVSGGQLEGNQVKGIASTLTGNSLTYVLQAPATGSHTFSGTYQFTDDSIPFTTGGPNSLSICASQASVQCVNDDEYYFDSCGNQQSQKLDCGNDVIGSWGSDYCSGLDIMHDRTNTNNGCSVNACFSTPSSESSVIESCTWRCTTGNCMRNSNADSNANGGVSDTELLSYANSWLTGSVTDINLLNAASVWLGQSEVPVVI